MRRAGAIACGALLLAGVIGAGLLAHRGAAPDPAPSAAPRPYPHGPFGRWQFPGPQLPSQEEIVLAEVRSALEDSYYRFVPQDILEQPSVDLMLGALDDPYTEYLDPGAYQRLRDDLSRSYFGVGLTVGPGDSGLIVTSSLDGPAREAGIRPGDVIVAVDGHEATGLPLDRLASLIKGEQGTVVHLTVRREGTKRPITFTVVRRAIDVPSVRSRLIRTAHHRIGYVRVLSFREDVGPRVATATRRLARRGAEAFVLDLRGDPGGLLDQSVQLTSVFVPHGLVVSTSSLHRTRSYSVTGAVVDAKRPLAVLIDRATASAAEIAAAALSENGRAVLVGRRTYGKATVQTLLDLSNGGALKLTTATYLTPSGTSIREKGIRPDVKAEDDPLTRPDEALVAAEKIVLRHA
jgi:carboxyl-terminal processing protease